MCICEYSIHIYEMPDSQGLLYIIRYMHMVKSTCNNWVWRGRSCWDPCTWPARQRAPSGGHQSSGGANWPRTHLEGKRDGLESKRSGQIFVLVYIIFGSLDGVSSSSSHKVTNMPFKLMYMIICILNLSIKHIKPSRFLSHPSSWAGDRHPVCNAPLERWTTRWGPGPTDGTEPSVRTHEELLHDKLHVWSVNYQPEL